MLMLALLPPQSGTCSLLTFALSLLYEGLYLHVLTFLLTYILAVVDFIIAVIHLNIVSVVFHSGDTDKRHQ